MPRTYPSSIVAIVLALGASCFGAEPKHDVMDSNRKKASAPVRGLFTGKVVFLREVLKRRKIEAYDDHAKQVVLETPAGKLIPILNDWRGRAFHQDERLRDRKVELIGFLSPDLPYLRVISVYVFDETGRRLHMDYWCDICAIPMYEIQECECCREEIRLRLQPQELPDYIKPPRNTSTKTDD